MNEEQRMEIVLKLDDAAQRIVEVVKLLQDQLSPEDFPFIKDGWEQNEGFTQACLAKLKLLRDADKIAFKAFGAADETIHFCYKVDEGKAYDYGYGEAVSNGSDNPVIIRAETGTDKEPLMAYGPTALAKARETRDQRGK